LKLATSGTQELTDATMAEAVAAYNSGKVLTQEQAILLGFEGQVTTSTGQVYQLGKAINSLKSKVLFVTTYVQKITLNGSWLDAITQEKMKWRSASMAAMTQGELNLEGGTDTTTPDTGGGGGGGGGGKKRRRKKRAAGGSATGLTWVGEQGPELVDMPGGSMVHNNRESMAMAGFDYDKLERTLIRVFRDAAQRAAA
jgi:hypothetical protein